jgi:hypothetical protein
MWCWWCCHTFDGNLLSMPHRYNERTKVFETSGRFKPKVDNTIPFISNTQKMNEIQNSTSGNNALKLKRNKPLKRNHNNLESALGLIITPKT